MLGGRHLRQTSDTEGKSTFTLCQINTVCVCVGGRGVALSDFPLVIFPAVP